MGLATPNLVTLDIGGGVTAGGLGCRTRNRLPPFRFAQRIKVNSRCESLMAAIRLKPTPHPQRGLFGAAPAFASEHLNHISGEYS